MHDGRPVFCDRHALMLPMLGLYADILQTKSDPVKEILTQWLEEHCDEVFPPTITVKTHKGMREQELFGRLATLIKARLLRDPTPRTRLPLVGRMLKVIRQRSLDPPEFGISAPELGAVDPVIPGSWTRRSRVSELWALVTSRGSGRQGESGQSIELVTMGGGAPSNKAEFASV